MEKKRIVKVWVDEKGVYAMTENNLVAGYSFGEWKRLREATQEEREDFYLTYSGVHWPQIDEDLSFEGMFSRAGFCSRTDTEDSVYWEAQSVL